MGIQRWSMKLRMERQNWGWAGGLSRTAVSVFACPVEMARFNRF